MSRPFKMKYKNSAFPFRSPLKQGNQLFDVTGEDGKEFSNEYVSTREGLKMHAINKKRIAKNNEIKKAMKYSTKYGHRRPTEWEKIKSDFTGENE
jgi:hypothetical protein